MTGVLLAITASLVGLEVFGLLTISRVRAYVGGADLWAQAQNDAAYCLRRYAGSRDESDYQRFLRRFEVPLSDRRARLEMNKEPCDEAVAAEQLRRGGNHPDDVPGMVSLYRNFRHLEQFARAVRAWEASDVELDALISAAARLHEALRSPQPDPAGVQAILVELESIHERATALEAEFATALGVAARWITRILLALLAGAALLLAAVGIWLLRWMLDRIRAGDEAVRRTETVYRSLVEQSPFGIFRSTAGGEVVTANPALVAMLGYASEEELKTKDLLRDLYVDPSARMNAITGLLARGHSTVENRWKRKDGREILVRQTAQVVIDDAGRPESFSTIVEDITERDELAQKLLQSQKMEAIGTLAGGVAHDFNNIISIILSNAQLLAQDLPPDSPAQEDVESIVDASRRAAGLVRQLLTFSRRQLVQARPVEVSALVEDTRRLLVRLLPANIALRTSCAEAPATVVADPSQLEQVLLNLAVNARDAMPDGGTMELGSALEDEQVVLFVRDTGVGIPEELHSKIFEPFFTTKAAGKGTGLGLSTCYGIVRQAGGRIELRSRPGAGTTVRVLLPRSREPVAPQAGADEEGAQVARGRETLLFAEDEAQVREASGRMLTSLGYTVVSAPGGAEALEAARSMTAIDLLVTDVMMPGMRGTELAARLSGVRPGLRTLFISGYAEPAEVEPAMRQGAGFLNKPFTLAQLAAAVRAVLDRA